MQTWQYKTPIKEKICQNLWWPSGQFCNPVWLTSSLSCACLSRLPLHKIQFNSKIYFNSSSTTLIARDIFEFAHPLVVSYFTSFIVEKHRAWENLIQRHIQACDQIAGKVKWRLIFWFQTMFSKFLGVAWSLVKILAMYGTWWEIWEARRWIFYCRQMQRCFYSWASSWW